MLDANFILITILGFSILAALFAFLAFLRAIRMPANTLTFDQVSNLLRNESDQIRRASDEQARGLRQELGENLRGFQETFVGGFRALAEGVVTQIKDFGERLDIGIKTIDEKAAAIGTKLDEDIAKMGNEASVNRETLRQAIENKLNESAAKQASSSKELREEMGSNFLRLGSNVGDTINQLGETQKERLANVTTALSALSEKYERAHEALKQSVEGRLEIIRAENATKLDEMRQTVDEKLQSTLETRLGESFNRVVEQLERVHKGIGEMQSLAVGVGDLKKVLSNVRTRGTYGEIQLGALLEQFLSPEQFIRNAQIKENTQERVEFAIRFPGRESEQEVLLPIDAKFPQDDYERLIAAAECGDAEGVLQAAKELETRIRQCARTIHDKYISTPRTTEFAILFLPTESLYAEILRRPGFFEQLQREFHVTLAGPTTLTALLNAFQMGFRSLAIQKRSGEVWQILGAIRNEFGKYNNVVDTLTKQLHTAANSVQRLGLRTRAMNQKLRDVERLPDGDAQILLGPSLSMVDAEENSEEDDRHSGESI